MLERYVKKFVEGVHRSIIHFYVCNKFVAEMFNVKEIIKRERMIVSLFIVLIVESLFYFQLKKEFPT